MHMTADQQDPVGGFLSSRFQLLGEYLSLFLECVLLFSKWFLQAAGVLFFGGLSVQELARLLGGPVVLEGDEFVWRLVLFSIGGGVVVALWGLANRHKPRWGLGLFLLALILFGLLVWPTPFWYYEGPKRELVRVTRVTGAEKLIHSGER